MSLSKLSVVLVKLLQLVVALQTAPSCQAFVHDLSYSKREITLRKMESSDINQPATDAPATDAATKTDTKRVLEGTAGEEPSKNDSKRAKVAGASPTQEEEAISYWRKPWEDIVNGGGTRWIITDLDAKRQALDHITRHATSNTGTDKLNIFCPLVGSDLFFHYAWSEGHSVTGIDLIPTALDEMKKQFGSDENDWTQEKDNANGMVVWKHISGRAHFMLGNVFTPVAKLANTFDVVYDKDSFGAIQKETRSVFCSRLAEYLKDDGIVYTEVKFKNDDHPKRFDGPPFHIDKADLIEEANFGKSFEYIESLGEVYEFYKGSEKPKAKQMGHVLKRVTRTDGENN